MFNTKRPITKVEDLAGMKIRTGGGIAEEMARALGASAFVKPAPESYELLSSGVADGTFFPLESIISFKLDTVIKYATLFPGGFYSSAFGFFMNEDKWNKLSQAGPGRHHVGLGRAAGAARRQGLGRHRSRRAGGDEEGRHHRSARRRPSWSRACRSAPQAIIDKWVKDATAKGVDGAKVLAEFREELKRVAAEQVTTPIRRGHHNPPRRLPGSIVCWGPPRPCCCSA